MSNVISSEEVVALDSRRLSGKSSHFNPVPESALARKALRSARLRDVVAYEFTQDAGLVHQYCAMRESMFISVWGLKHFSGMKDRYDDLSQVLIARKGLQVIGGGRLTISTAEHRLLLPMEGDDFGLPQAFPSFDLSSHTFAEFSRLSILPEFRAGAVFPEIAKRFVSKAVAEGVDFAFNMAPVPLARNYRQTMQLFGLNWKICSDVIVPDREGFEGIKMAVSVMDLRPLHLSAKTSHVAEALLPVMAD